MMGPHPRDERLEGGGRDCVLWKGVPVSHSSGDEGKLSVVCVGGDGTESLVVTSTVALYGVKVVCAYFCLAV